MKEIKRGKNGDFLVVFHDKKNYELLTDGLFKNKMWKLKKEPTIFYQIKIHKIITIMFYYLFVGLFLTYIFKKMIKATSCEQNLKLN